MKDYLKNLFGLLINSSNSTKPSSSLQQTINCQWQEARIDSPFQFTSIGKIMNLLQTNRIGNLEITLIRSFRFLPTKLLDLSLDDCSAKWHPSDLRYQIFPVYDGNIKCQIVLKKPEKSAHRIIQVNSGLLCC